LWFPRTVDPIEKDPEVMNDEAASSQRESKVTDIACRREEMKMKRRKLTNSMPVGACMVLGLLLGVSFGEAQAEEYKLKIPFGLEETAVVIPVDNPLTKEKVELGRVLFFDKR
jgi:hypothetical protein